MAKVTANMSMSLDGFIAGANVSDKNPMGDGGDRRGCCRPGNWVDHNLKVR